MMNAFPIFTSVSAVKLWSKELPSVKITKRRTLTPAVVKQDVNFLESSEISLHRTTVNLKEIQSSVKREIKQLLQRLHTHSNREQMESYCDRTLASVLPLEKRIISASLWKSSMDRAVSSARLLMAAAWTSYTIQHTHTVKQLSDLQYNQ